MKDNHKIFLAGLLGAIAVAAGVTGYIVYKKKYGIREEAVSVFSNVPGEAPYSDLLGNPVSLNEHLGKILVVTTWANWSPFSAGDLSMLNKLAADYSAEEVVFMAINRQESKEQAARFLATIEKPDRLIMVLDPRDHFYAAVGGYAMPEVLVYNKRGDIVLHERGVANESKIRETIENTKNGN